VKLRAGDMVTAADLVDEVELFAQARDAGLQTAYGVVMKKGEVALVIALDRHDARTVYIIGPMGAGWAFGAFLKRVK